VIAQEKNGGPDRRRVLIAGGGIAGLEALLALNDLAGERVDVTLAAPDPEFTYRPMIVEEPFSLAPAERRDLGLLCRDLGARFVQGAVRAMIPDRHVAILADGSELDYDAAIVCVGARSRPAYPSATTLRSWSEPVAIDEAIDDAATDPTRRLAFVVPPRIVWSLPLYELAMLTQRRAVERGLAVEILIVTPEAEPLSVFGHVASSAVADLLAARGIEVLTESSVAEVQGGFVVHPGGRALDVGAVVALPVLTGPGIEGLAADARGFIRIDEHASVPGAPDVFAAGDGTIFPIKQGGLATQQADAAAEMVAALAGAPIDPQPLRPVLRGKLITGSESLHLSSSISGGGGEPTASLDYLWWPPKKVAGKFLAPFLAGASRFEPEPPGHSLDVEVSVPSEWHSQPMALDPLEHIEG
jgi:sulfide:quinone oxidoreductase